MNEKNNFKCCTDCNTTKTPLWRGGPAGPKSLCNACGIRYRKRKRVIEGLKKRSEKKEDKTTTHGTTAAITSASAKIDSSGSNACVNNGLSDSFKMRLMALGKEVLLQKSSPSQSPSPSPFQAQYIVVKKQRCQRRRKLKEEEQAAFSLMALSCGYVFA